MPVNDQPIQLRAIDQRWQVTTDYCQPSHYLRLYCLDCAERTHEVSHPEQRICLGRACNFHQQHDIVMQWLKATAQRYLLPWLSRLSQQHNLPYASARVRNQRTRWGSCTEDKAISLNLKLLFLPPKVAQYVMVHELCHTVHIDHSKRFWRCVEQVEPNYRTLDKALLQYQSEIPGWVDE